MENKTNDEKKTVKTHYFRLKTDLKNQWTKTKSDNEINKSIKHYIEI